MQLPLLLIHGAIGASSELQSLLERLSLQHEVHAMDLPGHGGAAMPAEQFSMPMFAEAVLQLIKMKGWKKINVFGHSMGGYVAMYVARHHPEVINRIVTFGTKYTWDADAAAREIKMLHPVTIVNKVPAFAKILEERHGAGSWQQTLSATADLLRAMGDNNPLEPGDFVEIKQPVLLMLGDRDKMVTMEETESVCRLLLDGQMAVLPDTPHALEKADVALLSYLVDKFLVS